MSFFSPIENWILPEFAITESIREMARDGKKKHEGIVLWLGKRSDEKATVSHLVLLRGQGIVKEPNFLRIESWLLNEVTDVTIDLGVAIIGQIHSHGAKYGTNLSFSDRKYGIAVPYYLSIVAPSYAMKKNIQITDYGIHLFEQGIGYRRLSVAEIKKRIMIIPNGKLPVLTVGNV